MLVNINTMINKVYDLQSDMTHFCSFIQDYPDGEKSIMGRSRDQRWRRFGDNYVGIILELQSNDFGKKTINLILVVLYPHFLFSVKWVLSIYLTS